MHKDFNIDYDRKNRLGFDEVIFGSSKDVGLLLELLKEYESKKQNVLITKLQKEKANVLKGHFDNTFYDASSQIFTLYPIQPLSGPYRAGVITAGSSDNFVANEAYYTLQYMGFSAERISDIGVAGLHRLLNRLDDLKNFEVLIVIAGFEGALPTVMGGLLPQPIIAVPTSVGYGVTDNGKTALHGMLGSCANGLLVTNIDNGYGAAMAAIRILNVIKK